MATLAAELRTNPITVSKCRLPSATNGLDGLLDAPRQGAARTIPANVVETVVADRLESAHRRENCSTRGLAAKHGTRPSNHGQDLSERSSSNRRQPPDQGVACSRGSDDHSRRLGRGRHQPAPPGDEARGRWPLWNHSSGYESKPTGPGWRALPNHGYRFTAKLLDRSSRFPCTRLALMAPLPVSATRPAATTLRYWPEQTALTDIICRLARL
jgi:hypothetical protein